MSFQANFYLETFEFIQSVNSLSSGVVLFISTLQKIHICFIIQIYWLLNFQYRRHKGLVSGAIPQFSLPILSYRFFVFYFVLILVLTYCKFLSLVRQISLMPAKVATCDGNIAKAIKEVFENNVWCRIVHRMRTILHFICEKSFHDLILNQRVAEFFV